MESKEAHPQKHEQEANTKRTTPQPRLSTAIVTSSLDLAYLWRTSFSINARDKRQLRLSGVR